MSHLMVKPGHSFILLVLSCHVSIMFSKASTLLSCGENSERSITACNLSQDLGL